MAIMVSVKNLTSNGYVFSMENNRSTVFIESIGLKESRKLLFVPTKRWLQVDKCNSTEKIPLSCKLLAVVWTKRETTWSYALVVT